MLTDERITALVMVRPDMAQAVYHDLVPIEAFVELARAVLAAAPQPPAVSAEPVAEVRCVDHVYRVLWKCSPPDDGTLLYLPTPPSADAQDAARYRWLRANHPIHDNSPFICRNFGASFSQWTGEHADAAIDEAMENGGQP